MEQERSNINTGLRAVLEGSSSRTTTREELTTATTIMKQQQEDRRTRPTQLDGRQNHPHVQSNPQAPPHQPQKCPRCDSMNTKFCYYNNYSLSQPRYFCKTCRRYWTHGGTLRNVPVGGGCRKAKRSKPSSSAATDAPRPKELLSAGGGNLVSPLAPTAAGEGPLSYSFFGVGGGFLSSLAAAQSLTQTPPAPPPFVGASGGCATSLGFFQGFGSSVLPSTPFGSHQSQQIHQIQPAQMFHQVVHPSLSSDHQERTSVSQGKPTIITSSAAAAAHHHGEWSFMMSNAGNSNENPSAQGLWSASGDRNGVGAGVGSSSPPPPLSLNQTQLHDHHHHLPGFGPPQ